jgi:hypothetical protein
MRFRFCWARRRAGRDVNAPPLPTSPTNLVSSSPLADTTSGDITRASLESSNSTPQPYQRRYPAFEMFHSQEAAKEARRQRRSTNGVLPTSVVERARRMSLLK